MVMLTKSVVGRQRDDDRGTAGGEVLAFGMLIFVIGSLLILSAWQVVDAKFASSAAAREATRVFVEQTGSVETARSRAVSAATEAFSAHGLDPSLVTGVSITGSLDRCARVRTEVTYRVPGLVLPWIDGIAAVDVRADHSEIVDPLRAGLDGEASCLGV